MGIKVSFVRLRTISNIALPCLHLETFSQVPLSKLFLLSFSLFQPIITLHSVMTKLRLAKKLQPAKKAWKSLSNTLQSSKLHKLNNIPKALKTTLKRLLSTFHSLMRLIPSKGHHHHHRSLTSTLYRPYATSYNNYHVQHNKNFAAIHIDDLYAAESASAFVSVNATNNKTTSSYHQYAQGETSKRGKEVHIGNDKKDLKHGESESSGINNNNNTIEDAWKAVVAKSPMLQVDQKAEEFIYKFREDMRLQKEKSLLEFQERLARST